LNGTSYNIPTSSASSIIPGGATESWYNATIGDETPAGGFYSSINDLRKIGISMLNSTFLDPAQTRRWMQPHAFTSSPNVSVGATWEILRAPSQRTSWIYTKAGDLGLYCSQIALLPEHGVGFSVLGAGAASISNVQLVSDLLAATYVPALEAAAKEEAYTVYAGTYHDAESNSTLIITTNSDPGLVISEWTFNGGDFLALYTEIVGNASMQHTVTYL
jgi:CubicO group peptidase (beta-lactamase class C family)